MTKERAIAVLSDLMVGVHPITGENLPSDGVFDTAEVVLALNCAVNAMKRFSSDNTGSKPNQIEPDEPMPNKYAGRAWTDEDDRLLMELYNSGASLKDMGIQMERREKRILNELTRMGLPLPYAGKRKKRRRSSTHGGRERE